MKALAELHHPDVPALALHQRDAGNRTVILQELDKILTSRFFRTAGRSRQFLQYVVQHKLDDHVDLLKERTIGVEVFQRAANYATGDDPVVRVQAGEVRRRLEQYYQSEQVIPPVSITLPVGSYSPIFQWASEKPVETQPAFTLSAPAIDSQPTKRFTRRWIVSAVCVVAALAALIGFTMPHRTSHQKSTLDKFWNPVFATQQPVLICLAKPIVYRPSNELYERYSHAHPGKFETEVERTNQALPLDPDEKISWRDMQAYVEYGVAQGDVYAGVSLSGMLGRIDKPSQVRIGSQYTFEDLRNSPAIVVGAFNNRWTMHLTSNLHFAFVDKEGIFSIREQTPSGRTWPQPEMLSAPSNDTYDYAIVSRLLDSKSGQFTVSVAGIGGTGTQAAAEFVSNPALLEKGLQDAPTDWPQKNLQVVLQTTITDSVAGPPRVVATYFW